MYRPRFRTSDRVIVREQEVFLLSEVGHVHLKGRRVASVAALIDGKRTVGELIAALNGTFSEEEVVDTLHYLAQRRYLVEQGGDGAFWELCGQDSRSSTRRLSESTVEIRCLQEPAFGIQLQTLLEAQGMRVGTGGLLVVVTDDWLEPALEAVDAACRAEEREWLLIRPVGLEIRIGPHFRPGQTGCWHCLAHRERWSRKVERHLVENLGVQGPMRPYLARLPGTFAMAAGLAAVAIARSCVEGPADGVFVFHSRDLHGSQHRFVRRPQCPACGDPQGLAEQRAGPVILQARPVQFLEDGGFRSVSPETTYDRYQHHISHVTGVISRLWRSETGADVVRCYCAEHNFVHMNEDIFVESIGRGSGGKGKTLEQARAGALAEALERYSGVWQGDEPGKMARLVDLGEEGIHPNATLCVSTQQYENRDEWNRTASRFSWVPERFDPEAEVHWTPVWSLTHQRRRYACTATCYYEYAWRHNIAYAKADSNGAAAGNNLEEAVLQGLMELVERDAVAIWWYNQLRRPAVNLDAFGEPYFGELKAYYQTINRDLVLLDITSDSGIPVYAAVSRRLDRPVEDIITGFGAHLDPRIAASRAVTELNQSLPCVIRVSEQHPDAYVGGNRPAEHWWKNARISEYPFVSPAPDRPMAPIPERLSTGDLVGDISLCVERLARCGVEVLVLDQSRADIGLKVVRVMAPGLRPFWARFAPGRLYDVPVKMGERNRPLRESELNPFLVYF